MKDNSLYRLGGIAAILVGITYVITGITNIFIPSSLNGVPDAQSPFMYWEESKVLILTNWWATLIGAVFALAMIPAVSGTVQHLNEGWVRWTKTLATLAFAVAILDNYWSIVYTDARAQAYMTGSESIRSELTVPGARNLSMSKAGWHWAGLDYGSLYAAILLCVTIYGPKDLLIWGF